MNYLLCYYHDYDDNSYNLICKAPFLTGAHNTLQLSATFTMKQETMSYLFCYYHHYDDNNNNLHL